MDIIVTTKSGTKTRRYVVVYEDRNMFAGIKDGPIDGREELGWRFHFGAQWLRGPGRVDEMYRTLSGSDIVRVTRKVIHRQSCSCGCGAS
jgi:hypothetical protein